VLAQQRELHAERLLAGEAVRAPVTGDSRIDYYAVARRDGRNPAPDRLDGAGAVRAQHPRRDDRDARQALDDEEVEVIQCGRGQPHADVG
jgi:hypothetical protein